jgi:hypothetical protein
MHGLIAIVAGGRITIPCPIVLFGYSTSYGVVGKPMDLLFSTHKRLQHPSKIVIFAIVSGDS